MAVVHNNMLTHMSSFNSWLLV